jgi:hypothetical protein
MAGLLERVQERQSLVDDSLESQAERVEGVADQRRSLSDRVNQRQELLKRGVIAPDPMRTDFEARDQFLAGQAGTERLAAPGFEGFIDRSDLSLSDTFGEKQAKFLDKFPDGDFIAVQEPQMPGLVKPPSHTILFRRTQDEQFAEFDARALDRIEILADLADLAGDMPSVLMEAIFTRGGALLWQTLRLFAAGATGELLKQSVEELRGFQQQDLREVLNQSALQGAFGATGALSTLPVSGPLNFLRGAGQIRVLPSAGRAQVAAKELGVPPLLPNQVASSPLVRKLGGQAAATTSAIGNYVREQNTAIVQALLALRKPDFAKALGGKLAELHESAREQILAVMRNPRVSLTEAGTALQGGIAEYDNLARMTVNGLYSNARSIEVPRFDTGPLLQVAREVQAGTPTAVATRQVPARDVALPVEGTVTRGGGTQNIRPAPAAVRNIIDEMMQADAALPTIRMQDGSMVTATDQLRAWQQRLWDIKTTSPGALTTPDDRAAARQAGKLYAAITHVLRDPANTSPAFRTAWETANVQAARRFDTMEKLVIRSSIQSEAPAEVAARLALPNKVDSLQLLKGAVPAEKYSVFQDAVKADFLRRPDSILARLDTFDQPTLDLLMNRLDQANLRMIGGALQKLDQVGMKQVLEVQSRAAQQISGLIDNGQTEQIARLVAMAGPDPEMPLRRSVRAALMQDTYDRVVATVKGVSQVNEKALTARLADLTKSGAIKLLSAEDIHVLNNLRRVSQFVPQSADPGTSLVAASTFAGLRELSAAAFQTLLENVGAGRFLTSSFGRRVLIGTGKAEKSPFTSLRVLGAALAQFATDLEEERQ